MASGIIQKRPVIYHKLLTGTTSSAGNLVTGYNVASVSKEIWNWTDTYVINVGNPQDALYALMLVLAIDAEKCSRRD